MFAGNLGAVIAGAPLAWLVTQASWRSVFVGLAVLSALLAVFSWWRVRDRPEDFGLPAVNPAAPSAARLPWMRAVARVLANRVTWPAFFVNVGVGGSYLAFAGLWAVPFLQQTRGMTRVDAAQHTSLLLLGVAIGSLAIGLVSDRLQSRRGVMRAFVCSTCCRGLRGSCMRLADRGHPRLVPSDGTADPASPCRGPSPRKRTRSSSPASRPRSSTSASSSAPASCSRWSAGCSTAAARRATWPARGTGASSCSPAPPPSARRRASSSAPAPGKT